ncbi:MAG: HU family DNA-binding protein [Calditrichae bacterium]|nr:HU family DNA-binding protein [Calditrichota bacterium]MCB9059279.1 HU family DNA-binding protein [Calditrichia bacterium]
MNTSEVIKNLAARLDKSQTEIKELLHNTLEIFRNHLISHDKFTIPGFGTFDVAERKHKIAYNPHYKKKMLFPKKMVAAFRPAKALQENVNQE